MYSTELNIEIPKPHIPPSEEQPLIIEGVSIRKDWFANKSLMELINAHTDRNYSLSRVDFSTVKILPDDNLCNSEVQIINRVNDGLFNPKIVQYNRIHVSELGPIVIAKRSAVSVSDLLPAINKKYNLFIQSWDISDSILPPADAIGNVSINFTFTENCLQFYSGTRIKLTSELNPIAIPGHASNGTSTYASFPWSSNNW
jgi:hypothetical protein